MDRNCCGPEAPRSVRDAGASPAEPRPSRLRYGCIHRDGGRRRGSKMPPVRRRAVGGDRYGGGPGVGAQPVRPRVMFYNPVRIHFGNTALTELPKLLGSCNPALITTAGMVSRGTAESVTRAFRRSDIPVFSGVQPNPTIASITQAASDVLKSSPDVLIAVGGGSTIDTAKG